MWTTYLELKRRQGFKKKKDSLDWVHNCWSLIDQPDTRDPSRSLHGYFQGQVSQFDTSKLAFNGVFHSSHLWSRLEKNGKNKNKNQEINKPFCLVGMEKS